MRRFGCSKLQPAKNRSGAYLAGSFLYRESAGVKPVSDLGTPCQTTSAAAAGLQTCKAAMAWASSGVRAFFLSNHHIEVAMAEHKTEKFSSFTQWLSGRLNLPADAVAKTILLIPADERREIRNLRQWRINVSKYS